MQIAYKSNEVTRPRVKCTDSWNRISLRSRRVRKITDCFQTNHSGNLIAASFATSGVDKTAHLLRLEIGRLLVHKRDETYRARCRSLGKSALLCDQRHVSTA